MKEIQTGLPACITKDKLVKGVKQVFARLSRETVKRASKRFQSYLENLVEIKGAFFE